MFQCLRQGHRASNQDNIAQWQDSPGACLFFGAQIVPRIMLLKRAVSEHP